MKLWLARKPMTQTTLLIFNLVTVFFIRTTPSSYQAAGQLESWKHDSYILKWPGHCCTINFWEKIDWQDYSRSFVCLAGGGHAFRVSFCIWGLPFLVLSSCCCCPFRNGPFSLRLFQCLLLLIFSMLPALLGNYYTSCVTHEQLSLIGWLTLSVKHSDQWRPRSMETKKKG